MNGRRAGAMSSSQRVSLLCSSSGTPAEGGPESDASNHFRVPKPLHVCRCFVLATTRVIMACLQCKHCVLGPYHVTYELMLRSFPQIKLQKYRVKRER